MIIYMNGDWPKGKWSFNWVTYTPCDVKHVIIMRFCMWMISHIKRWVCYLICFYYQCLNITTRISLAINTIVQRLDINGALDILRWDIPLFKCIDDCYVSVLFVLIFYLLIWIQFRFLMVQILRIEKRTCKLFLALHGSRSCIKNWETPLLLRILIPLNRGNFMRSGITQIAWVL